MSRSPSLQGHLLVAAPDLADPNFRRTVVVIAEHTPEAAMGLILNRPLDLTVAAAVPLLSHLVGLDDPVYEGGPVERESVVALAEFRDPHLAVSLAFGAIGFLGADADPEALDAAVEAVRVFSGYSGWGPGQLDEELTEEAWITLPAERDDVFGSPDGLWGRALRRKGGRYRLLATMPDDPTVN